MIARFKIRSDGPKSLTLRGVRYEQGRIYTTTKNALVSFLRGREAFVFLSIEGQNESTPTPKPKPPKAAPKSTPKGGPISSAALRGDPAPEPEKTPEPPAKKTRKRATRKKRTTRKK